MPQGTAPGRALSDILPGVQVCLFVSVDLEQFGLDYLYTLHRGMCVGRCVHSGVFLEVTRNAGVGKFHQEKSNVEEILWERKCMDFERRI